MEDELAIRTAMKRGLKRAGHEVDAAANLSEARELAEESQPDMLLSDLKLPDGSGLQMAEELRIPFIIMSGYAVFDDAVAALRLGCVDFFTKPVSIEDIVRRIEGMQAGQKHEHPSCIEVDDGGVRMVQARVHDFTVHDVYVQTWAWSTQSEARAIYEGAQQIVDSRAQQLLAELLQSSAQGRLVVNQRIGCCALWLDVEVQWQESVEQGDRLRLIQTLSDLCVQRSGGIFVECYYGTE